MQTDITLIPLFEFLTVENLNGDHGRLTDCTDYSRGIDLNNGKCDKFYCLHIEMFIPGRAQRLFHDGGGVLLLPIYSENRERVWQTQKLPFDKTMRAKYLRVKKSSQSTIGSETKNTHKSL